VNFVVSIVDLVSIRFGIVLSKELLSKVARIEGESVVHVSYDAEVLSLVKVFHVKKVDFKSRMQRSSDIWSRKCSEVLEPEVVANMFLCVELCDLHLIETFFSEEGWHESLIWNSWIT
jgi:hypothetical protein